MEEVEPDHQEQRCWISDMKFIGSGPQGITSFVLYTIKTEFPSGQSATCIRRYSDFEWLQKQLEMEFRTTLIPVIPEKEALFRFTAEVVGYRRRELGRFLSRLVSHPKLCEAKVLDLFLTATRDEFNDTRERSGSVDKTTNFISNILSSVSNIATDVYEIDDNFTCTQIYIDTLNETYRLLETASDNYNVIKTQIVDNAVELARAVESVQRFESKKDQHLSEFYAKLNETILAVNAHERKLIKAETERVTYTFKDQVRLAEATLRILKNRHEALKDYQIAQSDTKAKQDKQGTQTEALDLAKATEREEELKQKFEEISKEVGEQIETYKLLKSKEVRVALKELALKSIEAAEQNIATWEELGRAIPAQI